MKKIILAAALAQIVAAAVVAFAPLPAAADVLVRGYTKSNGTYVGPYIRTSPNGTCADNYGGC